MTRKTFHKSTLSSASYDTTEKAPVEGIALADTGTDLKKTKLNMHDKYRSISSRANGKEPRKEITAKPAESKKERARA